MALNARLHGAHALFSELVELKWDGPCIVMRGRSGDYIASGHMTPAFAMELHQRLGELLAHHPEISDPPAKKPKRRKKKR